LLKSLKLLPFIVLLLLALSLLRASSITTASPVLNQGSNSLLHSLIENMISFFEPDMAATILQHFCIEAEDTVKPIHLHIGEGDIQLRRARYVFVNVSMN
jgi:hypothetical protein